MVSRHPVKSCQLSRRTCSISLTRSIKKSKFEYRHNCCSVDEKMNYSYDESRIFKIQMNPNCSKIVK